MNREPHSPPNTDSFCAPNTISSSGSVTSNASSFYERLPPQIHNADERPSLICYPSIRDVQKASMTHLFHETEADPWAAQQVHSVYRKTPHPRFMDEGKRAPNYQTPHVPAGTSHKTGISHDFLASSRTSRSMHRSSPSRLEHGCKDHVNYREQEDSYYERIVRRQEPNFTNDFPACSTQRSHNRHVISDTPSCSLDNDRHDYYQDREYQQERTAAFTRQSDCKNPPPLPLPPPFLKEADAPVIEIEISPGCYTPLRGSAETLHAFQHGDMIETLCFECLGRLGCISNCSCVLCPDCRVVSPVEEQDGGLRCSNMERFGVGLGLKLA